MAISINGTTGISGVDGSAGTPAVQGTDSNTGLVFPAADTVAVATSGTERMRIDSSGNVGIGTSSPSVNAASVTQRLSVNIGGTDKSGISIQHGLTAAEAYASVGAQFAYNNTGSSSEVRFINTVLNGASTAIGFATNDGSTLAERARIDSSGNFWLGGATANVAPVLGYNKDSSGGYWIKNANTTSVTTAYDFLINNVRVGAITTSGSSTAYATSSDYRLKENISPLADALTTVAQLKPVNYTWKSSGEAGHGFIAHELQAVVPDCVIGEKDAVDSDGNPVYQGIDTSFLVATLTAAIQELKAENDALKARLDAANL